jgi:hypothetical protein
MPARRVDDSEPAMTEGDRAAQQKALAVRPAMLDGLRHTLYLKPATGLVVLPVPAKDACNSTHDSLLNVRIMTACLSRAGYDVKKSHPRPQAALTCLLLFRQRV